MDFTPNQQLAIDVRDRNLLISAAAGSGKTATLTERILSLLTDKDTPADINRMLIVTFTRAAAGELRTRISKKLSDALAIDPENDHLARQLTSLSGAKICTIDSYYLDLVRSNFQKSDLPASFRIADETELKILRYEVMNSIIERRYATDPDFGVYADTITTAKEEGKLAEILLDIERKTSLLHNGTDYLSFCAQRYKSDAACRDFFMTDIGSLMKNELSEELTYLLKRADKLIMLIDQNENASPYGKAVCSDKDQISSLLEQIINGTYAEARESILDYNPQKLGTIRGENKNEITEQIKEERTEIKERLLELRNREFGFHPDDLPQACFISAALCEKTADLLNDYTTAYRNEKSLRSICEFSNLKTSALALLIDKNGAPTAVAENEKGKYDHIFVDEYQDTDSAQDLVFRTISNGKNLFFVGDIKQSIYSFRGAVPAVFSSYRRSFPQLSDNDGKHTPASIFMSDNFRCSPAIISFTNAVCSYLFRESECKGRGIGYLAEDDLIASRQAPYSDEKVHVVLLENQKDSDDNLSAECRYVISRIRHILKHEKDPNGNPYRPKDIAILTRSNKEAALFASALAKAGISNANSTGSDLFENPEVLLMLSLLSAADNPQRDIPLAGALRSPVFGFSLSDLVNVKNGKNSMSLFDAVNEYSVSDDSDSVLKNKCRNAIIKLDEYRARAQAVPVHLFMRYLWKDTNALSYAGSDNTSRNRTLIERRRNLRSFYEYARKYEASSFKGLHDFVKYVNGIIAQGTKISSEDAVTDDTVQIMTIHKSKGLEFPNVFIVGCNKTPNETDSRKNIVFSTAEKTGIAFKISDSTGLGQLDTPYRIAIADSIASDSSDEEIRILYVALTRARENLYIVASGSEGFAEKHIVSAQRRASIGGRYSIMTSGKYIERILTALCADPTNHSYSIEFPELANIEKDRQDQESTGDRSEEKMKAICDLLRPSLEFKYPYEDTSDLPAKVSVSRLYPELLNDPDNQSDLIAKAQHLEPRIPRFKDNSPNAAERGTATHLFLQFCDQGKLQPTRESVMEEISRLVSDRYISSDIANLIRIDEIVTFAASNFFKELQKAKDLYREFRFNVFLPASDFTTIETKKKNLTSEKILVQGVIDLCFVNAEDELILCDYKTDRLSRAAQKDRDQATAELSERHWQQLKYYSAAIEQILGKRPDKIFIYSLAFGDALEIKI